MTSAMLRGADLAALNDAGNRWGSWVASRPGAMPEFDEHNVPG
jgi:fructokinase